MDVIVLLPLCAYVCVWVKVSRERRIEEQMCAVLWLCAWTDGDQVQPLSPQHLSPLARIQLPRATPPPLCAPPPSLLLSVDSKAEMCIYMCMDGCRLGLPWPGGGDFSSPLCLPPSLTGDCWRSQLACSWPIRSIWYRRRKESLVNVQINRCCLCFWLIFFFIAYYARSKHRTSWEINNQNFKEENYLILSILCNTYRIFHQLFSV